MKLELCLGERYVRDLTRFRAADVRVAKGAMVADVAHCWGAPSDHRRYNNCLEEVESDSKVRIRRTCWICGPRPVGILQEGRGTVCCT